jgi:nitrogen fixation/metabolism regulation signal transduction histidine kinase
MSKRKKYVLDRKFQLRTTFSMIGLLFVAFAIVVAIAGINLLDVNERIGNVLQINKAIADTVAAPTPGMDDSEYKSYVLMQNMLDENKKNLDSMIQFNTILIMIVIGIVIAQALVIFFVLIRQTHRIVGPIYVMTNYMRQIADGHIPDHIRELRKNDFFQDSYAVFRKMVETLKKK